MKKHLQNLHPEVASDGEGDLEQFWKVEKMEPQQVDNSEKLLEKPRKAKTANPSKKEAKEGKEPQGRDRAKAAEPSKAKEEPAKTPSRFVPSQVVNQYYPPMQSDMFSLAYRQPLLYPQQNYELLCMLQAVNQGTAVNPSSIWVPKVSDAIPPQAVDPLMAQQVPYPAQPAKAPQSFEQPMDLLTRAKFLSTSLNDAVPLREHPHVHNEFCGHNTIKHNGHIDYIHDAELHYVSTAGSTCHNLGEVFPHKLGVTETNPADCRPLLTYPWHADGPPADLKDGNSFLVASDNKESEKIGQLMEFHNEEVKKHPIAQTPLTVSFPT